MESTTKEKQEYPDITELHPQVQDFLTKRLKRKPGGVDTLRVSENSKVTDDDVARGVKNEYDPEFAAKSIMGVITGNGDVNQTMHSMYGEVKVIPQPKSFELMSMLADQNVDLTTNIECYAVNIGGMGWALEPVYQVRRLVDENKVVSYIREDTEEPITREQYMSIMSEKDEAKAFIENLCPGLSYSTLVTNLHRWKAKIGNMFWEPKRSKTGALLGFGEFSNPTKVWACYADKEPYEFDYRYRVGDQIKTRKVMKRFRRYIQRLNGGRIRFYKEFGDPRDCDANTGQYYEKTDMKPKEFVPATEIVHFKTPGIIYGNAIWAPSYIDAFTARSIRLTNRETMDNSGVPRMAVVILNSTDEKLEKSVIKQLQKNRETGSRETVMVLRVSPEEMGFGPQSEVVKPEVRFEPLSRLQEKDGMFLGLQKYLSGDADKCFRQPSILKGQAGVNTNRAIAYVEKQTAESQVFGPPRREYDEWFNNEVMLEAGFKYWKIKSLGAPNRDTEMFIQIMSLFIQGGAYTPNDLRSRSGELLDQPLPKINEEWADIPRFSNYFTLQQQQMAEMLNNAMQDAGIEGGSGALQEQPMEQMSKELLVDFAKEVLKTRGAGEQLQEVRFYHHDAHHVH